MTSGTLRPGSTGRTLWSRQTLLAVNAIDSINSIEPAISARPARPNGPLGPVAPLGPCGPVDPLLAVVPTATKGEDPSVSLGTVVNPTVATTDSENDATMIRRRIV